MILIEIMIYYRESSLFVTFAAFQIFIPVEVLIVYDISKINDSWQIN